MKLLNWVNENKCLTLIEKFVRHERLLRNESLSLLFLFIWN
jgi:hypothetical protein